MCIRETMELMFTMTPPPACLHDGDDGLHGQKRTVDVQLHDLAEIRKRHVRHQARGSLPRVVDEDVHPAEPLPGRLGPWPGPGRVAHVRGNGNCLVTLRVQAADASPESMSVDLAARTSLAPARASSMTVAVPMPAEAPVTIATLSRISIITSTQSRIDFCGQSLPRPGAPAGISLASPPGIRRGTRTQ